MARGGFSKGSKFAGPQPIFKKRDEDFDVTTAATDGVILGQATTRETGTIYAVKVGVYGQAQATFAAGDSQRIDLYVDCIPSAGASIPNLSIDVERETLNGFYVGSIWMGKDADGTPITSVPIIEKFRFRRLCDENSLVRLLARAVLTSGSFSTTELTGVVNVVIRTR